MQKDNFKYRLYGRSKGRKNLKKSEKFIRSKEIKKLIKSSFNIIDVGSGFGESSIYLAKNNNNNIVVACEKYLDGLIKTIKNANNMGLDNLFLFQGNVHQFIDEHCFNESISEVWILFPDPWPKKKHQKRRLIDINFLKKLKIYLKKNATIHIATDSKSYICHILILLYFVQRDYLWVNQNIESWNYSLLELPDTKYYKKARKNGDNPFYVKLQKL